MKPRGAQAYTMVNSAKKRLLVLGGLAQVCDIVKNAQENNIHVIVTDYITDSPAKMIADEVWDLSITDVDGIVKRCKERGVDGVMNYCIDPGQIPYYEICKQLDVPCYGTKAQFEILTNKDLFKRTCIENDVSVVSGTILSDKDPSILQDKLQFPIVVKPADSRASKGISICHNRSELRTSIAIAKKYSKSEVILAETLMDGPEVAVKYFVSEGEIALSSMSDIHTYFEDGKRVYIGSQTFPSKYFSLYLETTDEKVRAMIESLGIRNGPLSFSGFVDGRTFRFIDPSFRLGGAQDWRIVEQITGVNIANCLTEFALTGTINNSGEVRRINCRISEKASAMLYFLAREGTVGSIVGLDEVRGVESIIGYHVCHHAGSVIDNFGTSDHVVLRFLLVTNDVDALKAEIRFIQSQIDILDIDGKSMKLLNCNPDCL